MWLVWGREEMSENLKEKRLNARQNHRCEDNIKMSFKRNRL
jgi:hypothetical protein